MLQRKQWTRVAMFACMAFFLSFSVAAAATGAVVWTNSAGNAGWGGFMQKIMQPDYRLSMSNGSPYWNTLMLPVSESAATSGQSTYMGMPAFGFCPVAGQCYMVLVQPPAASSSFANCPPVALPAQPVQNQQGKPNSLW